MPERILFACRSIKYAAFMAQSQSRGDQFYLVEFDSSPNAVDFREGWKCDCPAFEYGKTQSQCKHILMMKPRLCMWNQANKTSQVPVRKNDSSLVCPLCGDGVFTFRDEPIPDASDQNLEF